MKGCKKPLNQILKMHYRVSPKLVTIRDNQVGSPVKKRWVVSYKDDILFETFNKAFAVKFVRDDIAIRYKGFKGFKNDEITFLHGLKFKRLREQDHAQDPNAKWKIIKEIETLERLIKYREAKLKNQATA